MEKIVSKRFNPQYMISKRMGMSLPNLQDIKPAESPTRRNSSLRRPDTNHGKGMRHLGTMLLSLLSSGQWPSCFHSVKPFSEQRVKATSVEMEGKHDDSKMLL